MTWRAFIGGALFLVPEQVAVKHCARPSRAVHPISVGAGRVCLARLHLWHSRRKLTFRRKNTKMSPYLALSSGACGTSIRASVPEL